MASDNYRMVFSADTSGIDRAFKFMADESRATSRKVEQGLAQVSAAMARVTADTQQVTARMQQGFAQVSTEMTRVVANTGQVSARMQQGLDAVGGAARGLVGLVAGISFVSVGRQAVEVMSSFEQLEIRLNSVMGSAAAGSQAFGWIKQFAKETPFEVEHVTQAFLLLKNLGLDPTDGSLQAIADQAAKSGGGFEGLQRVALALGQAWTKTKLQGEEAKQLLEAGVPVWDLLAKVTGKNTEELQKLSEKGALGRDVIKALLDEIGRSAAGGAAAQMQSLSGQMSNLADNIKGAFDTLRQSGGLDGFKLLLAELNSKITELAQDGTLAQWAKTTADAMRAVAVAVSRAAQIISDLGPTVLAVLMGRYLAPLAMQQLPLLVGRLGESAGAAAGFGRAFISAQGPAVAMTTAVNGMRVALAMLGGPMGLAITAVTLLAGRWMFAAESAETAGQKMVAAATQATDRLRALGQMGQQLRAQDVSNARADLAKMKEAYTESWKQIQQEITALVAKIGRDNVFDLSGNIRTQGLSADLAGRLQALRQQKQAIDDLVRQIAASQQKLDQAPKNDPATPALKQTESGKAAPSRMGAWEEDLAQQRLQSERDGHQLSLAEEIRFWEGKKAIADAKSGEMLAISRKITALELQQYRAGLEGQKKLDEQAISATQQQGEARLTLEKQAADFVLQHGQEGFTSWLAAQRQFEADRHQQTQAGLQARLATSGQEPQQLSAIQRQIEADAASHAERMAVLDDLARQSAAPTGLDGWISQQREFEVQRYQLQLAALNARAALAAQEPATLAAINQQIEQAESEHYNRLLTLGMQGAQRQQQRDQQLGEQQIAFAQQKGEQLLALDQQMADFELQQGQTDFDAWLAQQRSFEARRYQLQLDALEARRALLQADPAAQAGVNQQIELAQIEHNQRMQAISIQAAEAQGQEWEALQQRMEGLWDAGIQAMMQGTLSWRNAFKTIGAELAMWFAKDVVGRNIKSWLIGETTKTGATKAGVLERFAAETWGAIKSVALWAWAAIKNIANMAWEAMAGAYKAIVGIPYVGPFLAPVMAGAAFAGVIKLVGNVASASGGYDIPAGLNPLTQLHEREMVLPAKHADVIRGLADGQGPAASGDNIHLTVQAVDAASVRRLFHSNRFELAEALKAALRDGKR